MSNLTVKQLIAKLRRMPPDAVVIWKDHDNDPEDFNDFVRFVEDVTDVIRDDRCGGHHTVALSG